MSGPVARDARGPAAADGSVPAVATAGVAPPDATAETRRLALELLPHADRVAASVMERVLELAPDLTPGGTAESVAVVRESTEQNIGAMLATLAFGVAPGAIEPPVGTLKLLRQSVAAGGGATTIMHAYRVGHERLWRVWADHVVEHVADATLLHAVLGESSSHFFAFIDRSCEGLVEAHRREYGEAPSTGAAGETRGALVRALAAGEPVDPETIRARLAYDVADHHIALVARPVVAGADARAAIDAVVAAADGHGVGAGPDTRAVVPRLLAHAAGDGAWWAWLGFTEDPSAEVRESLAGTALIDVVVGLGRCEHGADGFRRTHEQALDAERTARLARSPRPGVVRHEDAELAGLLCHDRARAERMAATRLRDLARPDEASVRLRLTLRAYLDAGRSKKRTAERLHVHQKTVAYRLARAEQLLGGPLDEGVAELDAALRIHLTLFGS